MRKITKMQMKVNKFVELYKILARGVATGGRGMGRIRKAPTFQKPSKKARIGNIESPRHILISIGFPIRKKNAIKTLL
jgi:hypothetical protein